MSGERVSARLHRWGAVSGIAFAVLAVGWFVLAHVADAVDAPDHILEVYADSGARVQMNFGILLLALAGICFLGFLADLYSVLRVAVGETSPLPTLALAGGVGYVALLFAAGGLLGVLPNLILFDEVSAAVDADLAAVAVQLGLMFMFVFALASASPLVLATSLIAKRTGLLPKWLARTGFVLAGLLLLGATGPPFFLMLLWVAAVSVTLRPTA